MPQLPTLTGCLLGLVMALSENNKRLFADGFLVSTVFFFCRPLVLVWQAETVQDEIGSRIAIIACLNGDGALDNVFNAVGGSLFLPWHAAQRA